VGRAGLPDRHYVRILHSLGQAVHVISLDGKLMYWNRYAEHLYGYSVPEAVGQDALELIVHPSDYGAANDIIQNIFMGKCWRGKFPVKHKSGERFNIVASNTPLYDDDGSLVGLICLSTDTRTLEEILGHSTSGKVYPSSAKPRVQLNGSKSGLLNKVSCDSQQPLQSAITSRITNLSNKHRLPGLQIEFALGSRRVRIAMISSVVPVRAIILNMMPEKSRHLVKEAPQVGMFFMGPLLVKTITLGSQAKQTVMTQEKENWGFTKFLAQQQRHCGPTGEFHGLGEVMEMMMLGRIERTCHSSMKFKRMDRAIRKFQSQSYYQTAKILNLSRKSNMRFQVPGGLSMPAQVV
jgi:PAS domain S-box-containing protein